MSIDKNILLIYKICIVFDSFNFNLKMDYTNIYDSDSRYIY